MKIGIARADLLDPVLAHQNSRVSVVKDIAGESGQFQKNLFSNIGVSLRRNEYAESRRLQ